MPSQFFGLNIAYTGLLASNAALNTTSNNIANVQTEGYSRQQVTTQAANALRVFQTYGCAGAGVETLAIERVRNEFYDFRFWNNNEKVGEYEQKIYYMEQIESYFHDNGQNAGFKTVFDQLMITGLQELMKNPDNLSFKEQFVGYAGALTEYFNNVAGNLEKLQKDVNEEIKVKVDEINSIASEIAALNKQINTIELKGVNANELRDRRTLLVDQLSQIVDVEVKETKIADLNNPDRNTGGSRFTVKIAGGQVLVDNFEYNGLKCVSRTDDQKVNQTDVDGLYDVVWDDGTNSKFNLYGGAIGGALKGLIDLRDGNNGESFSGVIVPNGVDNTNHTVTVKVDKHYLKDLNKCNLSDSGGVIKLGNKEYYYDSWTYSVSYDNGEPEYTYTFQMSDTATINAAEGSTASVGKSVAYQGVPYYMAQMNEWIRTFSQKFNDILTSGYAGDQKGIALFTANMMTENKQYFFGNHGDETEAEYVARVEKILKDQKLDPANLADKDKVLAVCEAALQDYRYDTESKEAYGKRIDKLKAFNTKYNLGLTDAEIKEAAKLKVTVGKDDANSQSYYLMTAKYFDVSNTVENDPSLLATKKKEGDGAEQNDLLEDINKIATDKGSMSFRGCSASEFLQCILSDVALNASRAETFYSSYADIAISIDTQRISISGVDEDEEAVNLVKYQNGYTLASKMIQTLTEVYDRLILQTGV
ncbi:flagellar hook-associated protein FlgK [uncultured Acetatifactor sp.]|uniref:flagellar hook-associated protein FlgK n=1 Tax=uncultured Acetatifactor sp. TaxID=1671927 RepID=UPI002606B018|nr:flagellar hook-associated protein FlgK [uncultured Acetatifactor sp.]